MNTLELENKLKTSDYKISMSDLMKILDNVNKWVENWHGVYEEQYIMDYEELLQELVKKIEEV